MGHMMAARWLGPEMMISEAEALELARAYVGWRKNYGGVLDPKTDALVTLIIAAAVVEGPRLMRVTSRRAAQKQAAKVAKAAEAQSGLGNIVDLGGLRGV